MFSVHDIMLGVPGTSFEDYWRHRSYLPSRFSGPIQEMDLKTSFIWVRCSASYIHFLIARYLEKHNADYNICTYVCVQ